MAQRQLSRTLPKNFTFPSLSIDEPKTPERPASPFKVPARPQNISNGRRRLRGETISAASRDVSACIDLDLFQFRGLPDVPLPSIEVGQSSAPVESSIGHQPINDERYLAPPRQRLMFKTPPAQIRGAEFESNDETQPWPSWDQTPLPHDIPRPGSACSTMSDSSVESIETYASRPSIGGSCSSVESDIFDSFPIEINKDAELSSPTLPKKMKVQRSQVRSTSWTRDMDNHLWNTYQIYLQDPTMTPFKMTPGSIPPLGVTTRVARRAKKTWEKKHRLIKSLPTQTSDRSGSSTPTAMDGIVSRVSWPKSDAKTRHRLKMLCRRKFSIMPHYHRMMQSCSPEPAENEDDSHPAYGTRDLGVSLVTSFASNPLSQFAEEPAPEIKVEPFNNHVQSDLDLTLPPIPPFNQHLNVDPNSIPRLGSPFVYSTWGPGGSTRQVESISVSARRETVHVPNRVRRNTHFAAMTPRDPDDVFSPKTYVDNDPSDEEVHRRLNEYMRENKGQNIVDGRARVPRSRGLTTGAVSRSRDVSQLFSPPSSLNSSQIEPEETTPVTKPPVNPLLNLGGEHIKRLGSPFKAEGGFKRRTAPGRFIRHAPSLSDPSCNVGFPAYPGSMGPSPIQEQPKPQGPPPSLQNPFEEGLSDAERIRRQILNMHSTRN
ncbi:uncharacterized protein N7483_008766 [Penicillium malachiteum]|uniref:uncharacterized protein n=1 Tax=Penicillium malachiteum TaxID=1324776 RepID=UPI0025466BBA|nr:uncharacterized protein N7483_008766 [Penicillium malachiteum]KAJ5720832.1 hypothetical protein N7483_008766 [Penicillium malachiteum]